MGEWNDETNRPFCYFIEWGMDGAICPILRSAITLAQCVVTRLETDLAGVWLLRLLPGMHLRLQLYLTFKQSHLNENKVILYILDK